MYKKINASDSKKSGSSLNLFFAGIRRVFLWILHRKKKKRASLTVEAAVVVPVFVIGMFCLYQVFDMYRIQGLVKTTLHQCGKELGMYGCESENNILTSAYCMAYTQGKMPKVKDSVKISLLRSRCVGDQIELIADISYQVPLLFLPSIHLTNRTCVRRWDGRDTELENETMNTWEEMVYITEYESVYHDSQNCTHLDLSIHKTTIDNAKKMSYRKCSKCGKGETDFVYYTEQGECYHSAMTCSGLKRTVYLVEKSQVKGLEKCKRCQ